MNMYLYMQVVQYKQIDEEEAKITLDIFKELTQNEIC